MLMFAEQLRSYIKWFLAMVLQHPSLKFQVPLISCLEWGYRTLNSVGLGDTCIVLMMMPCDNIKSNTAFQHVQKSKLLNFCTRLLDVFESLGSGTCWFACKSHLKYSSWSKSPNSSLD